MKQYTVVLLLALLGVTLAMFMADTKSILCSPCRFIFKEVAKELPEADKITEETLKVAIKVVCSRFLGGIPLVKEVCEKLGDDAVYDLYKFILKEDKKINPESICKHLHMC